MLINSIEDGCQWLICLWLVATLLLQQRCGGAEIRRRRATPPTEAAGTPPGLAISLAHQFILQTSCPTPVRTACPLRPQRPIFCALVFFSPSMHAYAVRVVFWVLAFASTRPAAKFSHKAGRPLGSDLLLQPYMTVTQRKPVGQKKRNMNAHS
jgi:hypothetical protein